MRKLTQRLCLLCLVACFANVGHAQKWGHLSMTFVYDGKAPKPVSINVTKDIQFCGKFGLKDDSLIVNPKNSGIKNVVVYLRDTKKKKPAIHPSFAKKKKKPVLLTIDNKKCRFEPRIAFIRTKQQLMLSNADAVAHNTKIDTFANPPVNPLLPPGAKFPHVFANGEILPAVPISCGVHPWMRGYIVVRDHPYGAVSNKDGKITIKNIPVGKWTFQLWQEKSGYVTKAVSKGKLKKWRRGRIKITIKPGMNDLGTLLVPASEFAKP